MLAGLPAAAVTLAGACRSPTQVTLILKTDIPCAVLHGTSITVGSGRDVETRDPATTTSACSNGEIGSVVLVPTTGADDRFSVKVVAGKGMSVDACAAPGYGPPPPSDVGCVVARRSLGFIPQAPLTLPIDLRAECVGVPCAVDETCVQGACVSSKVDPDGCTSADGCPESALLDGGSPGSGGGGGGGGDAGVDGPVCSEAPCKLVPPQCGCPDGEGCVLVGVGKPGCVAAGTKVAGEACGVDLCAPGFVCQGLKNQKTPTCHQLCESDGDCGTLAGKCAIALLTDAGGLGVKVCSDDCNPVTNAGCPAGTACRIVKAPADPVVFAVCLDAGAGQQGDTCAKPTDCEPGFQCVLPAPDVCAQFCVVASPTCDPGTTCHTFEIAALAPVIGGVEYGLCLPP